MAHVDLREMAFQMRSDDLRSYGEKVLARNPERRAAYEVLDLMAYLVACDFIGAEAKVETIKYKFKGTRDETYIDGATYVAMSHINLAYGRFDDFVISTSNFLNNPKLGALEEGEYLDILRLKAQKQMILDEIEELEDTYKKMHDYKVDAKSVNLLFLVKSVEAMLLMTQGDFKSASEVARKNLEIAKQNGYTGLMAPLDSLYVLARCQLVGARNKEAFETFEKVKDLAERYSQWPWYFMADGFLSREYALKNQVAEALDIVRKEREKLATLNFKHNLDFIPDVNELYCRYAIKDIERMETLLKRLPDLVLVRHFRGYADEYHGKDMSEWIKKLPDRTPREKLYKFVAYADYYKDKETLAIDYMSQALQIAEETGQVEFILRQTLLLDIILKAIAKKPTLFLEHLAGLITERVRENESKHGSNLPIPLTSRELEIVRHLSTGKPISQIGGALHVSMNTMKTHLRNIYRKLEVDGREKAVEKAKELFLI